MSVFLHLHIVRAAQAQMVEKEKKMETSAYV